MVSNKLDKIKFCKNCVESNQRFMGSIQHLDTKDGIKQRTSFDEGILGLQLFLNKKRQLIGKIEKKN